MGSGGSRCTKQDVIDKKPEVRADIGVTIAGSRECTGCSLGLSQTSTSSVIQIERQGSVLYLTPTVPMSVTFNGTSAVFSWFMIVVPAPLSIEHTQADAAILCVSKEITMVLPLKKSDTGASAMFLSSIAGALDPATVDGLGIVDEKTGKYKSIHVATGQDWSINNLVKGTDPYFTWTTGDLVQYTKSESECVRNIGWKTNAGPQVIYFQNPIGITAVDIDKIRETIGVMPAEGLRLNPADVLYSPGEVSCPVKPPALKAPTFSAAPGFTDFLVYMSIILVAFFAIALAVALVMQTNGPIQYFARGISSAFRWPAIG